MLHDEPDTCGHISVRKSTVYTYATIIWIGEMVRIRPQLNDQDDQKFSM